VSNYNSFFSPRAFTFRVCLLHGIQRSGDASTRLNLYHVVELVIYLLFKARTVTVAFVDHVYIAFRSFGRYVAISICCITLL